MGQSVINQIIVRLIFCVALAAGLTACSTGATIREVKENVLGIEPSPPVIRQPVLPEMLVNCRGHVLVPALGMTFVARGKDAPDRGQYLREERLTPPYRVIPPGARVSTEQSPKRLNVELDTLDRIIGLYCG